MSSVEDQGEASIAAAADGFIEAVDAVGYGVARTIIYAYSCTIELEAIFALTTVVVSETYLAVRVPTSGLADIFAGREDVAVFAAGAKGGTVAEGAARDLTSACLAGEGAGEGEPYFASIAFAALALQTVGESAGRSHTGCAVGG